MLITNHKDFNKLAQIAPQMQVVRDFLIYWQQNPVDFKEKRLSEQVLVRLLNYETASFEERSWEAHKREIDLHVILEGEERIYLAGEEALVAGEYHREDDYYLLEGNSERFELLAADSKDKSSHDMMVLWLDEAHKTGVSHTSGAVKKFVFKILP
ncbi:YhcH/YjgK/YiaL family protein [Enterococcus asini]|uniref:YhcH/YjgK/YiaL family protein n=1 Tax=Enterococcus asini TaxID=57732 RepID=UPI002890BADD|nr:YhcH/YjgK/YiaL family protein [Enterococcus asini]MDT2757632.1 YhcH/YjgK/YiaL family protein [Enterococcus asini]